MAKPDLTRVLGRVVDEKGEGVPRVRVYVHRTSEVDGVRVEQVEQQLVTDADGSFRCNIAEGESRSLLVKASDKSSASAVQVVESDSESVTILVQREPNLAGFVRDEAGEGEAFVRMQIVGSTGRTLVVTETDDEGRFEARLPADLPHVSVLAGVVPPESLRGMPIRDVTRRRRDTDPIGVLRREVPVGTLDLAFTLLKPVRIQGVLKTSDGRAVTRATLYGRCLDGNPRRLVKLQASFLGDDGRFQTALLRPGRWALVFRPFAPVVRMPGESRTLVNNWAVTEEVSAVASSEGLVVICRTTPGIRGRIEPVDVDGARVQVGAGYYVQWTADPPLRIQRQRVRVRRDGTFHIQHARHVPHRLYVSKVGTGLMADVSNVLPAAEQVVITLTEGHTLSGSFATGKQPAGTGLEARQGPLTVTTFPDEFGDFRFIGLARGQWEIRIVRPGLRVVRLDGKPPPAAVAEAGATNVLIRN